MTESERRAASSSADRSEGMEWKGGRGEELECGCQPLERTLCSKENAAKGMSGQPPHESKRSQCTQQLKGVIQLYKSFDLAQEQRVLGSRSRCQMWVVATAKYMVLC